MIAHPDGSRLLGYARVSTDDQDLSLQIDAIEKHGIAKSLIFTDRLSGAKHERPGLTKCLDCLQRGDALIVWRLDRLGRSMRHLVNLIESLCDRGIGFRSLSEGVIDTTNATTFNNSVYGRMGGNELETAEGNSGIMR